MLPGCWAIVPAAGVGKRVVGSPVPKQYLRFEGKTILEHALSPLIDNEYIAGVVVVLHKDDQWFTDLTIDCKNKQLWTVTGGATRAQSVLNALTYLKDYADKSDFVLVHDAARPCISKVDLQRLIDTCIEDAVGGILATPVQDTIKKVNDSSVVDTVNRNNLWRALTPQMFRFGLLLDALNEALDAGLEITDEASAVERYGFTPRVIAGDVKNIKVTTAEDILIAQMYLQSLREQ